jgi:hypothetical protein
MRAIRLFTHYIETFRFNPEKLAHSPPSRSLLSTVYGHFTIFCPNDRQPERDFKNEALGKPEARAKTLACNCC